MRGSPRNSLREITESLTFNLYTMKNLLLIIALVASTSLMSQTTLIMSDYLYDQGVESTFSVLYIPDSPSDKIESLIEGREWKINYREGYRSFILRATNPGIYQASQTVCDSITQMCSIRID